MSYTKDISYQAPSQTEFQLCLALRIFRELTECVQYLHEKHIIHRDFKPDNVLIAMRHEVNQTRYLKLCDLGVSKDLYNLDSFKPSSVEHTGEVGSPDYMAPEAEGETYNHKIDIYSLALIGAEMFGFKMSDIMNGKITL
ncbi:unnamed protein product [Oppiella nova]|uniref:Protein kinase domain-containing protein n=1 Tax=Oppiella nova TaxID=334625 RepID=A0A7R9QL66_9ACAR|nr:unnamed protein product [Oppiella nova]CAG2167816.1 unnamed protein product [Oppiella nova]